ncbi:ABC transporter permease [Desulforhopalus vacuolatus]|uniref:ABC transporter permease n=1 Tax=Desulforhopalus vacuolatus TaxID=40414 RepID=UPI0019650D23|nr:ABC transporter permease [Desulforhopalus vacuolatus]MBM9519001.1 ABC transporter permease [Desulforhopalus vacuolatus]
MGTYIVKRVIHSLPLLVMVIIFSFFVIHIMPGDPVRTLLGDRAPAEQVASMTKSLGLDQPLVIQFTVWLKNLLHCDFGTSISLGEPAFSLILQRVEPTFLLGILGTLISVMVGIPLGILSVQHHGKWTENLFTLPALVSISVPAFWTAILMIQLLAVKIHLFPVAGYHVIAKYGLSKALYDLLLPGLILGIMYCGQIARMTKVSTLEIMRQDYLLTARAAGISEGKILYYYALKNSLASIIVVIGYSFASMLAGAVVIEQIFNIPGLGNLTITSILNRDYPVIQGTLIFVTVIFIIINMLTDILCAYVNPKIKHEIE